MSELSSIVRCARALRAAGEPFLVATVVRVRGSAYRRPGARLLVAESRPATGSISAGCLESDIVSKGFWRTRESPAVVVTYDRTSDDDAKDGLGIGCDGVVDVLIERAGDGGACDPIEVLARALDRERPCAMATVIRSERADVPLASRVVVDDVFGTHANVAPSEIRADLERAALGVLAARENVAFTSSDGVEALVEIVMPPPHLFVFGSGPDAVPVVTMAKAVGWTVAACDRHARFTTRERFLAADRRIVLPPAMIARAVDTTARPLAVVLSHDYAYDRDVVRALVSSRAEYIGILGPRRRTERMLAEIGDDIAADVLPRIHAPVGLDIGSETSAEVALAIVAEAQAALTARPGGRLRERRGSIHAPPAIAGAA